MNSTFQLEYCILDCNLYCRHKCGEINLPKKTIMHNHDGFEILLFLGGDVSLFVESEEKKLERGDLVLFNAYAFHGISARNKESYERVTLDFRTEFLKSVCDEETDLSACFRRVPPRRLNLVHLDEPAIEEYVRIASVIEEHLRNPQYGSDILIRSLFSILMIITNRHMDAYDTPEYSSIMPPVVAKTFHYISDHLTTYFTVEDIACALHHNSAYLNRAFKQVTGCSLKQFISAKKISLAQQYLAQGYAPYDVCFMVGYNNYSSFSRQFSEQLRISPKQFQLKFRSGYTGGLRGTKE